MQNGAFHHIDSLPNTLMVHTEEYYIGETCSTNERLEEWILILRKSNLQDLLQELPVDRRTVLYDSEQLGFSIS